VTVQTNTQKSVCLVIEALKIFSLVGRIRNSGLVEVPFGTTIREVVYNIGGGPWDNKKIKAVQTGGPSGGCIPENMFDLPIDYEKPDRGRFDHGFGRHDRNG